MLWCRVQPPDHILQRAVDTSKFFKVTSAAPQSAESRTSGHSSVYQFLTPEENEAVSTLLLAVFSLLLSWYLLTYSVWVHFHNCSIRKWGILLYSLYIVYRESGWTFPVFFMCYIITFLGERTVRFVNRLNCIHFPLLNAYNLTFVGIIIFRVERKEEASNWEALHAGNIGGDNNEIPNEDNIVKRREGWGYSTPFLCFLPVIISSDHAFLWVIIFVTHAAHSDAIVVSKYVVKCGQYWIFLYFLCLKFLQATMNCTVSWMFKMVILKSTVLFTA